MFWRRRKAYVMYEDGNKPIAKFKNGDVVTSVWLNRTSKGHAMMMSFSRIQPDDKKEIKAFYASDLNDIKRGAEQAIRRMRKGISIRS